ncbi:hypothetical protein CLV44_10284 [Marinobacterium halophilum]|uniref:Uncharacterized protein n=1 Tax=Marinobacterium halophilum TaxID=267374 RepID=A0A2P8F375_9GAMM|nr:hypothetical protein CLV44_10284 [Marinobacterium halophilum]
MAHLAVLSLSILGFRLLAITTSQGAFRYRRELFWLGWFLLLVALAVALGFWSLGLGLTLWLGYLSTGAGVVFLVRALGLPDAR